MALTTPEFDQDGYSELEGTAAIEAQAGRMIDLPEEFAADSATFAKAGEDLVVMAPDGQNVVIENFFAFVPPPALQFQSGESVAGEALAAQFAETEPVQLAQAAQTNAATLNSSIGRVETATGEVSVVRADGSRETLEQGDPVFQGDAIETAAGSAVNIVFEDQTNFAGGESGRFVLNELIYNPDSSVGSMLLSVLKGVAVIVSGEIAKTDPDAMKVETPHMTMLVRGTTTLVEVSDTQSTSALLPDADGHIGELVVLAPQGTTTLQLSNQATSVSTLEPVPSPVFTISDSDLVAKSGGAFDAIIGGGGVLAPSIQNAVNQAAEEANANPDANPEAFETAAGGEPDGAPATFTPITFTPSSETAAAPAAPPAPPVAPPVAPPADGDEDETESDGSETGGGGTTAAITGTAANDTLIGTAGADTILGLGGDDSLTGLGGNDSIQGGAGQDTLLGGTGDDTLEGGSGNDFYVASIGNDVIATGGGNDRLHFTGDIEPITASVNGGGDMVVSLFEAATGTPYTITIDDHVTNPMFELSFVSDEGPDEVLRVATDFLAAPEDSLYIGSAGAETISGGAGSDVLIGNAGNDTLLGGDDEDGFIWNAGDGSDSIDGGADWDELSVNGHGTIANHWTVSAFGSNVQIAQTNVALPLSVIDTSAVEELELFGGIGADMLTVGDLTSTSNEDSIFFAGLGGDDFADASAAVTGIDFEGGAGDDTLLGGSGFNSFSGGAGNDSFVGGSGDGDRLDYSRDADQGGGSGVFVNLALGTAVDGFGGTDSISGVEEIFGTGLTDVLIGESTLAYNVFHGLAGSDVIVGNGGFDMVSYAHDAEYGAILGVSVNLGPTGGSGTATDAFGDADTLIDIEGVQATNLADSLTGGAGFHWFRGGGGNDTIDGGSGTDLVSYLSDVYFGATTGVSVDLAGGFAIDGYGDTDTLIDIEQVNGTDFDDIIAGNLMANALEGNGGNDSILGGGGIDNISGGAGNDTLDGQTGGDLLFGGAGEDQLFGDSDDFLDGGVGDDAIDIASGASNVTVHYSGTGDLGDTVSGFSAAGGVFEFARSQFAGADTNSDDVLDTGSFFTGTLVAGQLYHFGYYDDGGSYKLFYSAAGVSATTTVTSTTLAGATEIADLGTVDLGLDETNITFDPFG